MGEERESPLSLSTKHTTPSFPSQEEVVGLHIDVRDQFYSRAEMVVWAFTAID
jgi:hypothetical protein